jgi:hypothetical protein
MNYETSLKIIIFLIALYLLYYFNYQFDCDTFMRDLLKNLPIKEHFSIVFKPNKLYRFNNRIYLLDTNNVKVKDKNPKIFKNFAEYRNYIITLEDDIKNNFNDIGNIEDIQFEEEIKLYDHDIEYRNKRNSPDFRNFDYDNKCAKKVAFCNTDLDSIPFKDKIFNDKTDKCKEEICNINLFSDKQCEKLKKYNKNELFIKSLCEENAPKPTELTKECDSFNKYTRLGNRRLYDEFCIKGNNMNMNKCLLGEYFKDNLLEFEL